MQSTGTELAQEGPSSRARAIWERSISVQVAGCQVANRICSRFWPSVSNAAAPFPRFLPVERQRLRVSDQADYIGYTGIGTDEDLPDRVDEAAVARMQTVAHVLDRSIRVPGTNFRVGLDPILGVLPVAGDAVAAGLSLYIVAESARLGVSRPTLLRMLGNIAVDAAGGSIPLAGDLFDAMWKANRRNVELALEELASDPATVERSDPVQIEGF